MAGLTQRQLAERAGLSVTTLSTIEKGHSNPRVVTLGAIEAALEAVGIEIGRDGSVRPHER